MRQTIEELTERYRDNLFAAAFTAVYLQSGSLPEACKAANDLVIESIKATEADTHCYGVNFEYALAKFRK